MANNKIGQKDKSTGGKIDKAGPDNPAVTNHESDNENAFEDGMRIFFNQTLDQEKPDVTKDNNDYGSPADATEKQAKKLEDVRDKFAKNADKPTTASGDKGEKDLSKILQKVDPQQKAQVLPQLFKQMQQMQSILNMGSGMGGGGGGGGQQQPPSILPAGIVTVMQDSFTGALAILVRKHGFESVIEVMLYALENNRIYDINPIFRNIVKNAIANLIKAALYFGPLNIPISQYDQVVFGLKVPSPLIDRKDVPDYYYKVYYLDPTSDPYPGYQRWESPDFTKIVYTMRDPKSYVFTTPAEEIYSISETEIAEDLEMYFVTVGQGSNKKYVNILTGIILNDILIKQCYNIENNTMDANMGNNAGNNMNNQQAGGSGGSNMAQMLGGLLQQLMSKLQQEQLPKSVLNQGDIQKVMQQFQKDMGFNNQLFEMAKGALGGGNPLQSMLGGDMGGMGGMGGMFGGIQGIMGGFMSGGGGAGGAMGGNFGTGGGFGGGSSGGGGGAGSGFPTANLGDYNGGGISNNGMRTLQDMLTLLSIQET